MRVLIADDELANRLLLRRILDDYRAVCHQAANGQEAVAAFLQAAAEGRGFDVVFMDIRMPIMDGHQAVQAIRAEEARLNVPPNREVKVVMVTSLTASKDVMEAYYRDGCDDYLVKPVTAEQVEGKLREYGLIP